MFRGYIYFYIARPWFRSEPAGENETKNGVERFKHSNKTNTPVTDDEEAGAKTRF